MSRQQILERERRWARPAGFAAIAVAPLYIISVALDQGSSVPTAGLDTERYIEINAHSTELLGSVLLRALAFVLMVLPLLYLFRAAQARSPRVNGAMVGFVFIGPLLFGLQGVVAWIAQSTVSSDFVDKAAAGGDIFNLLDNLQSDSVAFTIAANLLFPAVLGLLVAMIYVPLQSQRVGLLTRFFATLGMALGAATLFIVPAISLLALVIWIGWLGFIILDRVPRARPPAWDAGEAIPWPKPGEEPEAAVATPNGVVEGDATEVFTPSEPRDQTARRERAKKRKRKRRG